MCQCILIPIKRLNDTSVDYIFYYKYMLSTFTYIARKKRRARQGTRKVLVAYGRRGVQEGDARVRSTTYQISWPALAKSSERRHKAGSWGIRKAKLNEARIRQATLRVCLEGLLWPARPSDQAMAGQSLVAMDHPFLFGALAQPSLDVLRCCLGSACEPS